MNTKFAYETKTILINADTITDVLQMENRRQLNSRQVNRLFSLLKEGKHFDSPFIVNQKTNGFTLLDGNHRLEAISQWIKEDSSNSISINFCIYKNLSEKEELEVFTKWNSGQGQSANDFIRLHSKEIYILQLMQENFPCPVRIYPLGLSQTGVNFSMLMKAYLGAKAPGHKASVYCYRESTPIFLADLKALTADHKRQLVEFVNFFERVFGGMDHDNRYQKQIMINCVAMLYFDNLIYLDILEKKLLENVFGKSEILDYKKHGAGSHGTESLYKTIKNLITRGDRKKLLFLRVAA